MEDNINRHNKEIEWDGVGWIDPAQVREMWQALVNMILNLWVP
jgi:hypothetical protein